MRGSVFNIDDFSDVLLMDFRTYPISSGGRILFSASDRTLSTRLVISSVIDKKSIKKLIDKISIKKLIDKKSIKR